MRLAKLDVVNEGDLAFWPDAVKLIRKKWYNGQAIAVIELFEVNSPDTYRITTSISYDKAVEEINKAMGDRP